MVSNLCCISMDEVAHMFASSLFQLNSFSCCIFIKVNPYTQQLWKWNKTSLMPSYVTISVKQLLHMWMNPHMQLLWDWNKTGIGKTQKKVRLTYSIFLFESAQWDLLSLLVFFHLIKILQVKMLARKLLRDWHLNTNTQAFFANFWYSYI